MHRDHTIVRDRVRDTIDRLRLLDSVTIARKLRLDAISSSWPKIPSYTQVDRAGFQRLLQMERARPDHPLNWHRQALEEAKSSVRAHRIYTALRSALWDFQEFSALKIYARRTLETVIELARCEGFPWYVSVSGENVMSLARMEKKTYGEQVRELECFAITRPARRIQLFDDPGNKYGFHLKTVSPPTRPTPDVPAMPSNTTPAMPQQSNAAPMYGFHLKTDHHSTLGSRAAALPRWPKASNNFGVDEREPLEDIPQWVIRYRRGRPGNKRRAAWWINYDLLCGTSRVLPCFIFSTETLAKLYRDRNRRFGRPPNRPGIQDDEAFAALERSWATRGPLPPAGLRVALWEGMEE